MSLLARLLACLALSTLLPAWGEGMPWVAGEPAVTPKAAPAPELRLGNAPKSRGAAIGARVELTAPDEADMAQLRAKNAAASHAKRVAIGINRALPADALPRASQLAWVGVDGGSAAQASVTSTGAASVRLALQLAGVPAELQMVFFGSDDPSRLFGPMRVGDITDRTQPWWSPLTEGDTQTIEFFAPAGIDAASSALAITAVSHLFSGPSSHFQKLVSDIGTSGTCNVDIACSALNSGSVFQNTVESVAQMLIVEGNSSFLCTGTLLADSDTSTQIPWFLSANHCMDNENAPFKTPAQMQTVANTLSTIWFFEANACHSGTPKSNWQQVNGGAQMLFNSAPEDALFLRLNNPPPAGAFYAGWDANPVNTGDSIFVIHHPSGDLKKVSQGSVQRFTTPQGGIGGGSLTFTEVKYSSGTTEPGSSGSALMTFNGSQYLVRGALWGGLAACDAITASDYYSRFDRFYPSIAPYLGATGSAIDYTDLWWGGNSQSGWGLNLIQHASRTMFGVWYTYDASGKRTWFVMSNLAPSNASANTYTGPIYQTSGPPANGATFDASTVRVNPVGQATLTFTDANNGSFAFTINGLSGVKPIARQPF